jgi:hypothetical protein
MVNLLPRRSEDSIDPLSRALSPPAKESTEQRVQREAKEIEARRVSERIDDQLKSEKQTSSRKKAPVRVLMLGQAESGALLLVCPPRADAIVFCICCI